TIAQARDLWARLQRSNTMIKVPATASGVPAVEQLTAEGVNVNVTLLFSTDRYQQVIDAYQAGLEARVAAGQSISTIASVASFFVSRVDNKVDAQLPDESAVRGPDERPRDAGGLSQANKPRRETCRVSPVAQTAAR